MNLCGLEPFQIFFLADLHGTQGCQMVSHELTVEQPKPANL